MIDISLRQLPPQSQRVIMWLDVKVWSIVQKKLCLLVISAFFPAKNTLLVKSVASKELVMPLGEMQAKEIPEEEIFQSLKNLEEKDFYNPLAVSSGLYDYLTSSLSKISKSRPSTNFVVPIINREEEPAKEEEKVCGATDFRNAKEEIKESSFKTDFLSASALFKKRFPNNLE
ncbi:uncharacterized protein CEXT_304791 [Caerostris extrusa]|uniref:Uncharacterized protein n=1 Tax=Caerostris extrusa TaxID=172846 RepID=A0AAV4S0M9_CAEEX|nr:uncharacterized protein CEXT_304791 [Caerostris extrusa]